MGTRGPKRLSVEQHKLRGSHRAKMYARDEAGKPKDTFIKSKKVKLKIDYDSLLAMIPGYSAQNTSGECHFDKNIAGKALHFFQNQLRFIEGAKANQPFALEDWQKAIIANLFGWIRPDGMRRYREAFIFVPRKNGKTPLTAGIVDYVAFEDGEIGAQIYSAASEREQAALVFRHAKGMILKNEALSNRCKIYSSYKSMEFPESDGLYKALSAEADTKDGLNSHLVIIDELHAQPNRELVDVLMTSTGSRTQPLIIHITTAGFDRNTICHEKYDYACKVRDGIIEDMSFLPVIYEAEELDAWDSEATWRKANPNLGVSITLEYLKRECQRAKDSPAYENTFRRLHLNQWTQSDVRYLSTEKWAACGGWSPQQTVTRSSVWYGGLDLSSTADLSAFVLVNQTDNGDVCVMPYCWAPKENARRRELKDRVPYETWAKQGYIELTDGDVIDYEVIRRRINEIGEQFNIKEIAVDRWNATQLITQLEGDGFAMVPFGQGFRDMTAPTKELEKLVISGKLRHPSNPVMNWCASNLSAELDAAGNVKPSKKKSTERIDLMAALIMAIGRLIAQPVEQGSVYESRGILTL